jgi:hypothetical protein
VGKQLQRMDGRVPSAAAIINPEDTVPLSAQDDITVVSDLREPLQEPAESEAKSKETSSSEKERHLRSRKRYASSLNTHNSVTNKSRGRRQKQHRSHTEQIHSEETDASSTDEDDRSASDSEPTQSTQSLTKSVNHVKGQEPMNFCL